MAYILLAGQDLEVLQDLQYVETFYSRKGHRIEIVNDGYHALDRILSEPPDILVTDIVVHGRDCFDLTHALKERYPERPTGVIWLGMVTAEVGGMLPIGPRFCHWVNAIVIKPFSEERRRLAPRRPVTYLEQLIVSVGVLLSQLDLELSLASEGEDR